MTVDHNATQKALDGFCIPLTAQQKNAGQVRSLKLDNNNGTLALKCVTGPKPNFIKRLFSDDLTVKQAAKFCSDHNISNATFFEEINRYNASNLTGKVPTQVQMSLQRKKMIIIDKPEASVTPDDTFIANQIRVNDWKLGDAAMKGATLAIHNKCNLVLREILKANPLTQDQRNELLLLAAEKNSVSCVKEMLKSGANVNAQVKEDTDKKEWTALMFAAEYGNKEMAKLLLSRNASTDMGPGNFTPLMLCAQYGRTDVAYELLDAGASVTQKNEPQKRNALGWAAHTGQLDMVKLLLRQNGKKQNVEAAKEIAKSNQKYLVSDYLDKRGK